MKRLALTWLAQYDGPSPLASEPVVVAEISTDSPLAAETVERAVRVLRDRLAFAEVHVQAEQARAEEEGLWLLGRFAAAWTLGALNAVRGYLHAAGATRTGGAVRIWVGFHDPALTRQALQMTLSCLMKSVNGEDVSAPLEQALNSLWQACRRHHPDFQARILMTGARALGVPYMPFLSETRYWQFGWGANARVFMESASNADGCLGWHWQHNKPITKAIMVATGMPTPPHVTVSEEERLEAAIRQLGFPCVIKPPDRGGGKGVTANISDMASLRAAFAAARQVSNAPLMVEKHVAGDDHRLLVINGKLVAAIRREPSSVVGDGHKTVAGLVADLNATRSSNIVKSRYLRPVALDEVLRQHLSTQDIGPNSILPPGRRVTLRSNSNLSTGGICTDVTGDVHPEVRAMAEQFALTTGLATTGLDYLTTDISKPPAESGGAFIEINTTPGLDACVAAGWPEERIAIAVLGRNVAAVPVELTILPPEAVAAQLESLRTSRQADNEGWVCDGELRVGQVTLRVSPVTPWEAVRAALRNRGLARLHVYCTARDVQASGLPVDRLTRVNVNDGVKLPVEWLTLLSSLTARRSETAGQ